jgi:hypothetical protein
MIYFVILASHEQVIAELIDDPRHRVSGRPRLMNLLTESCLRSPPTMLRVDVTLRICVALRQHVAGYPVSLSMPW